MRVSGVVLIALGAFSLGACFDHDPEPQRTGGNPLPTGSGGQAGSATGSGGAQAGTAGAGAVAGSAGSLCDRDGGAGPAPDGGCAPIDPCIVTRAIPCDVDAILERKCRRCHSDPMQNGAPFPLVTWANIHEKTPPGIIYERMRRAVTLTLTNGDPFMPAVWVPLDPPVEPLTDDEKATLLGWLDACAPPVEAGSCR
jgi:hypothetical protein